MFKMILVSCKHKETYRDVRDVDDERVEVVTRSRKLAKRRHDRKLAVLHVLLSTLRGLHLRHVPALVIVAEVRLK